MKFIKNPFLAALLVGASLGVSHADVLYTLAGPQTVNDDNVSLPGLSLSRTTTDTGTLYFKYTVTNPASNYTTENYFAGMSFYDGVYADANERLGVGNGWFAWAYSAFGTGNTDLNNPDPPTSPHAVKLVESSDITTIVFRVDFNSLANDNVTVWLNPNLSLTEAAQSASRTTYFSADATFTNIFLREGGGGGGWTFSDIAIAENATDAGFFAVPLTTSTWDGGGGDSNWSSAANWVGDTAPSAGFDLIFPFSTSTSPVNNLAAGTDFTGLNFAGGATSYTLTGNAIGISNFVRNTSVNPQAIEMPLELNGPLTFDALNAPLFIDAPVSGPHGVTKTGANRLELTANNSYTGDTAITTGTLSIGNGDVTGSIDPTGTVRFGAGTTTRLEIFRSDDTSLANPIITGGRANIAAVNGQVVTLSGPITGIGEVWTHGPGTVKIAPNAGSAGFTNSLVVATGTIEVADFTTSTLGSGPFFIGQAGSGTLRYTGPSATTDRLAEYALQSVGTNTFIEVTAPATELTFTQPLGDNAPFFNVGPKGFTKTGPGTLILAAAQTYTGNTVVDEGVLSLNQPGFPDSSTVTVNDGATLKLDFIGSDEVTEIVLGPNVFTTPGTYNATSHPTYFSGGGSLVIPSTSTPYETWGTPYSLASGSEGGDLDNDGLTNFEEFAFGLIPNSGSSVNPITSQLDKTTGKFTYQRLAASGLTYTIWTSPDLVTWTEDTTAGQVATAAGDNESVEVTLTGPLPSDKLFVRVQAD